VTYEGSSIPPTNAGSYVVLATITQENYTGSDNRILVIEKAIPVFSDLSAPTIKPGTSSTNLGGTLKSGSLIPPGSVSINLNGVIGSAIITDNGAFSFGFATGSLSLGSYSITYSYSGSSNYSNVVDSSRILSVKYSGSSSGGGSGGGGDGSSGIGTSTIINLDALQSSQGVFKSNASAKSSDGMFELSIPMGTSLNKFDGSGINSLTINQLSANQQPLPLLDGKILGKVYDLSPEGAIWSPSITVTMKYKQSEIISGMDEQFIKIGFWDNSAKQWNILVDSNVDVNNNVISARLNHFTSFAVIYKSFSTNYSLNSLVISPNSVSVGQKVTISSLLSNSGTAVGSFPVTLEIGGKFEQTKDVIVDANSTKILNFEFVPKASGTFSVKLNYLAGTLLVSPSNGSTFFTFSDLNINPDTAYPGDKVTISALVMNPNDSEVSYGINLKLNKSIIDSKIVTIPARGKNTVTYIFSQDLIGTYDIDLEGLTGSFQVIRRPIPASVIQKDLQIIPSESIPGGKVTIQATFINIGEVEGTIKANLIIDSKVVDSKELIIPSNRSQSVTFGILSPDKEGVMTIAINDINGKLEVKSPSSLGKIFVIIGILFLVAVVILFIIRKTLSKKRINV
jgi:hypothetical protein